MLVALHYLYTPFDIHASILPSAGSILLCALVTAASATGTDHKSMAIQVKSPLPLLERHLRGLAHGMAIVITASPRLRRASAHGENCEWQRAEMGPTGSPGPVCSYRVCRAVPLHSHSFCPGSGHPRQCPTLYRGGTSCVVSVGTPTVTSFVLWPGAQLPSNAATCMATQSMVCT